MDEGRAKGLDALGLLGLRIEICDDEDILVHLPHGAQRVQAMRLGAFGRQLLDGATVGDAFKVLGLRGGAPAVESMTHFLDVWEAISMAFPDIAPIGLRHGWPREEGHAQELLLLRLRAKGISTGHLPIRGGYRATAWWRPPKSEEAECIGEAEGDTRLTSTWALWVQFKDRKVR